MRQGARRRLALIMAGGLILVGLNMVGALGPVRSVASFVLTPFQQTIGAAGKSIGGVLDVVGSAGKLAAENKRLQEENESLKKRISADAELRAQNEALRKQLGFGAIPTETLLGAEVIAFQPDNLRQFITINRGSKDGVAKDMAVISGGSLVGIVSEVAPSSAKVFLVIDPNFRISALDQDVASRPDGTVRGQIGGGLIMEKIAQNEPVKAGDTVVTSGLGNGLPKGIIIGRVESVERQENGVFQTARLSSGLSFNRLEYVYVVIR